MSLSLLSWLHQAAGRLNAKLSPFVVQIRGFQPRGPRFNPGERMSDSRRRDRGRILWILGIVTLALLVRMIYWAEARHLSLVQVPTGDAATYVYLAEQLGHDGVSAPKGQAYQQAPLYPFVLFSLGSLGLDLSGVRIVQFLLGMIGAFLLTLVGFRWGGRLGGIVAGLGAALYGPFVFFESDLLSISVAVFFIELSLYYWGN